MKNYSESTPLAIIKTEIIDDSSYVYVRVNDSEPLWFNIDSGASACVIETSLCEALGITREGRYEGTGAGAGPVGYSVVKDVRYSLDRQSFVASQSYAIDLSGVSISDERKIAGLLGYDFFKQYTVVIDYDKAIMTLYNPESYEYHGAGDSLAISFIKKVPYIKGVILVPGQAVTEREWMVDSGSSDAINDELLAQSSGEKKKVRGGRGLGQEFDTWYSVADRIDLGHFSFNNVGGASGGMKIGGGLLRYFTVVFDYQRNRIILEPNRHYHQK